MILIVNDKGWLMATFYCLYIKVNNLDIWKIGLNGLSLQTKRYMKKNKTLEEMLKEIENVPLDSRPWKQSFISIIQIVNKDE